MDSNTPAMSLINGGVGNVQGQQLPEPAVKAATKVVNKYWDQHAQDLASLPGGIDLLHQIIQQHSTGGINDNPKIQPAQSIASPAQVTSNGDIQQGGLLSWIGGHSTDDLLKRLVKISTIQKNSSESSLQGTQTLGAEQKILAGQPGEIALPLAQAKEAQGMGNYYNQLSKQVNQVITKGGPPLSPEQVANFNAGINNLGLKQVTDLNDNLNKQAEVTLKQLDAKIKNTPTSQKVSDWIQYNREVKDLHGKLSKINTVMGTVNQNLKTKQFINPATGQSMASSNVITPGILAKAPIGATHFDPPTGKYYNAQGNEVR